MADDMNTERDMPEGITRDDTVHGETYYTAEDMATASAQGFRDGAASLSAAEPAGWKLVPVEPTSQQVKAAADAWLDCGSRLVLNKAAAAVRAGSAAAPSTPDSGGWMPIATAPKDGTEILLFAPPQEYEGKPIEARKTYGKWLAPSDTPHINYQDGFAPEVEFDDFDAHWSTWDGGFTPENPPTHWQPLPASPTIEGESNGK